MSQLGRQELMDHVLEQVQFLRTSSAGFDNGAVGEAKRLAVPLRVLLHETSNSHSLFGQLGWLADSFASIGDPAPAEAYVATGPLVSIAVSGYSPKLGPCERWVSFEDWWNEPVYKGIGRSLSRNDYIRAAANQGGGAHVDPRLSNSYRDLTHNAVLGWESFAEHTDASGNVTAVVQPETAMNNPMPASLRTITHELLSTLVRNHPEVCV